MASAVQSLTCETLPAWEGAATTVAFLGAEATLHAHVHHAAITSMAALKPELANWDAISLEAAPETLPNALKILHEKKVWGVVFTAPLKTAALKIFSPTPDPTGANPPAAMGGAEANAERVGAANLALWRPNGYWGSSTDGEVFAWSLEDAFQTDFKRKNVIVFGAGAFGRAVAVEALSRGCRELWIGDRSQERTWDAIDQVVPSFNMRGRTHSFNLLKPSPKMPRSGVIVNTFPLAARNSEITAIDFSRFDDSSLYFDLALRETEALQKAKAAQFHATHALRLFAEQVCRHVKALTGHAPDFEMALWVASEAVAAQK